MIGADFTGFPDNVLRLVGARILTLVDPDIEINYREWRATDGQQSISLFPQLRQPDLGSMEIGRRAETRQVYGLVAVVSVKDKDPDRSVSIANQMCAGVWATVYDTALVTAMNTLIVTRFGVTERWKTLRVTSTAYLTTELSTSQLLRCARIDLSMTTEVT